jgi:formate-dependent phosphoribosylglycinamide formyltransferase (GAR transformylase)
MLLDRGDYVESWQPHPMPTRALARSRAILGLPVNTALRTPGASAVI